MLAGGGVVYLDIERLLGEEALFLRDIDGDNGQVCLRLVAVHEDDAFPVRAGAHAVAARASVRASAIRGVSVRLRGVSFVSEVSEGNVRCFLVVGL